MALFQSLRIAAALPPLPSPSLEKHHHLPRSALLPAPTHCLQARNQNTQSKITSNLSRRDAMAILSSTLLANFVATDSAEAVRVKPETRKKIQEKLEKLKEKAGILKEKIVPDSDDKEKLPPSNPLPDYGDKGKLPPTNPPSSLSRPQVEADRAP